MTNSFSNYIIICNLKNIMKLIILTFSIAFTITACKKRPFDYRNKFLGEFSYEVHCTYWTLGEQAEDTTIFFNGNVEISEDENRILIYFLENVARESKIYEDGSMHHAGVSGEFNSKDNLEFKYSSGGLGGGTIYNVIGTRTK